MFKEDKEDDKFGTPPMSCADEEEPFLRSTLGDLGASMGDSEAAVLKLESSLDILDRVDLVDFVELEVSVLVKGGPLLSLEGELPMVVVVVVSGKVLF